MKSKKIKKEELFVVRLFKEEEMLSKIREFCNAEGITSATFTAIGALKKATLGFFNLERMEYMKFEVEEAEIASCTGNISIKEWEIAIHAHAVLSDMKGIAMEDTFSGHIWGLLRKYSLRHSLFRLRS